MRLRDVQHHLEQALAAGDIPPGLGGIALPNGTPGNQLAVSGGPVRTFLHHLSFVGALSDRARAIANMPVVQFTRDDQPIQGEAQVMQPLHDQLVKLREDAGRLAKTIRPLITREDPKLLSVKLPQVSTLRGVEDLLGRLRLIFDEPAKLIFGEGVEFVGVDTGSAWIDIAPQAVGVYWFTRHLIACAVKYAERANRAATVNDLQRDLGLALQPVADVLKTAADQLGAELVAKHAREGGDEGARLEAIGRCTFAVKTLGELFIKGTEVRLALTAKKEPVPENESADFPKPETFELLASAAAKALLTEGSDGNEGNKS